MNRDGHSNLPFAAFVVAVVIVYAVASYLLLQLVARWVLS